MRAKKEEQRELLLSVLARRANHLVRPFEEGISNFTVQQIVEAVSALEEELVQTGFREDWEPTAQGRQLEELIGVLVQEKISRERGSREARAQ